MLKKNKQQSCDENNKKRGIFPKVSQKEFFRNVEFYNIYNLSF